MNTLSTFDLSPLFRSTVGYDRISDVLDKAFSTDLKVPAYPPYNIEKLSEDKYRIVMAVAGFRQENLELMTHNNTLKISGKLVEEEGTKSYLHKGIATRSFERSFSLADHVKVKGAEIADGLLVVDLEREVPEEAKPRLVEIKSTSPKKTIEGKTN